MRILVVVHTFPPATEAGSEIYARDLAGAMRRGYDDRVLVLTREADPRRPELTVRTERRDGLDIAWINNTYADVRSFEDGYRNVRLGAIAANAIDDFSPDVAHVHHLTGLSTTIVDALHARGIPIVLTLHDYWLHCHRGQLLDRDYRVCEGPGARGCGACIGPEAGLGRIARIGARAAGPALRAAAGRVAPVVSRSRRVNDHERVRIEHMRELCRRVARFVAPSRAMRTQFVSFGVDPDRITVSAYGFDCAAFRTVAAVPADRLRVGFLGTLMVSKAPHVLLEAAKQLPRGSVSVDLFGAYTAYHGDDTYRARLDALLSESAGRARAHGAVPHSKVPEALASVDVLVVPSVWPENSPLVISEAFLAGVPVIASRIGGIPELVADGRNGLLFEPGSAADLARALSRLLTEAGLLDALRAGAKATRVRSIDDAAAEARRLYEALAAPDVERRPRLAAVVLNYRAAADTFLAVSSLRASRRRVDDLIVVDNDQTDAARAALARTAAHIRYVRAPRNLGYSGGMNVGIREALSRGADRVLLVNSDVVVPPDCVERLERAIDITPRAGITGPLVLARSDPDVVGSAGMSYRAASGRMRHRGFGRRSRDMELEQAAIVDGVSGCLMLVTREVFDAIGLLDEDYFFSFEDLDFCLRARRAGFSTVLAAAAAVHHEGGRSIGAQSPRRLYFAARGHLLLARRAASPGGRFAAACRTTSIVALNVAHAVRSSGAPLPVRLGAVARGVRDYFGGRFGPDRDAL